MPAQTTSPFMNENMLLLRMNAFHALGSNIIFNIQNQTVTGYDRQNPVSWAELMKFKTDYVETRTMTDKTQTGAVSSTSPANVPILKN